MDRIKKSIYITVWTAFSLMAMMSCAKTDVELGGTYNGQTGTIPVALTSKSSSYADAGEIQTVRCIVFTTDDKLVSNKLYNIPAGVDPSVVSVEMAIGRNDIYIVCNETPELGNSLKQVTLPEMIREIRFTPPIDGITNPVPMFNKVLGALVAKGAGGSASITVGGATSSSLPVEVTRIVARLGMTVIKNVPSNEGKFSIEKLTYRLCRLPKYSMLVEGTAYPQGEGWGPEILAAAEGSIAESSNGDYTVADGVITVPAGLDAMRFPLTYIPEHILQSTENHDYCSYLLIEAECLLNSSPIRTVYRLNLGKMPPADLNIERNVNYQIYATIRGLGATGFYAEIVPVEEFDLPITWKPFEGYALVGERVTDYGNNTNIWNSYSQYSGILKVVRNNKYSDVCFRYGSIVALSATTVAGEFNATTDVLWMPDVTETNTPITSWDDVGYVSSGDIPDTQTLDNIKQGKGDPCRLIGLSESEIQSGSRDNLLWRMPTAAEMQWLETARNYTTDARGFYSFSHLLTPFSGHRTATGTMVPADASAGWYWSATGVNSFTFGTANTSISAVDDPQKAYTVRCIRTDIPESLFSVNGSMITYLGGTVNIGALPGTVNAPHWRMELLDPADAAFVTLDKQEGSYKELNLATVQPLINPYQSRTVAIKTTGYGLDGQVHNKNVDILQNPLKHDVNISWTSVPDLVSLNGYARIPKSGAEISFKIQITPEPDPAYNPNFETLLWRIECKYYTDKLNVEYGSYDVRNGVSKITIKPNAWGHILGLEFRMVPEKVVPGGVVPDYSDTYPPHNSNSEILIQSFE